MKVYFGAAVSLTRKLLPLYQKIVKEIKKQGHQVISEYVADPRLKIGDGLSAEKLFRRETKAIDKVDLMVAEVTAPSWGTAFLMEHALKNNKPVLALFYKDNGGKLPMMVKGHPELYVESYDEDNLPTVLRTNLKHFSLRKKSKGKLIIIDGTNGSGKATQTDLLMKYFKREKIKANYISFPRYYTSFHGRTVGRFLSGEFGKLEEVSPYLSSLAFALDRLTARDQILDWLNDGRIVVADRYVTSSLAHQGAKLLPKERRRFINWIYDMEYKQHKMPKEDILLFLYVLPEISDKLILQKAKRYKKGKKKDIEEGLKYQRKVFQLYCQLAKKYLHWVMINCLDKKGKLKSRQEVHKEVITILRKRKVF